MMNGKERAQAIQHYRTVTQAIERYKTNVHLGRREYVADLQLAQAEAEELNRRFNLDNRGNK